MIEVTEKAIKIGASDVPAALGLSPFKSPATLAAELLGRVVPEVGNQKACDIGNRIESLIAYEYELETGRILLSSRSSRSEPGYVHESRKWLEVHPDYEALDRLVECKSVGPRMAFNWGQSGDPDGVPSYVLAQVVAQIACHPDHDKADVVAFFGGGDLRIFPVEPDHETIDSMLSALDRFMEPILAGEMPKLGPDDGDLVKRLYSSGGGNPIEADATMRTRIIEYRGAVYDLEKAEAYADRLAVEIKNFMGDHDVLLLDGEPAFTWKKAKDTPKVDWESVARELGAGNDLIAAHTKTKPGSRRFLSKIKDENNEK